MTIRVGKIYDIEGSPMQYLYRDGYWAMFEECYSHMPRKYVYTDLLEKDLKLWEFQKVEATVELVDPPSQPMEDTNVQPKVDN